MATDPSTKFTKALNYYMSIKGKKQQDLIQDLKLSSATVSQWVNGKAFPRMDRVEMLATYFNISTTDLLTDPTEKRSNEITPIMVAKLLEGNANLYDLLSVAIRLQEADIVLLTEIAKRLLTLEGEEL